MEYTELLKGFAARVGLAGLSSDDEGGCCVDIDGMSVTILELPQTQSVVLYGPVGDLPVEGRAEFLGVLLQANYLGQGTSGATLSQEGESGPICLHQVLPLALTDVDSFFDAFEKFVNTLETWRKLAADYRPGAAEKAPASEEAAFPPTDGGGFMLRV